jgi:uncharacterized protein (DUF2147 family)
MRPRSFVALLLLSLAGVPLRAQSTPAGRWQAISDVDGKPSALIEIREVDGEFVGTVVGLFTESDSLALCDRCDGERRDQRVLGLQILWGMRPDGDEWGGGSILDPESGRVYRARMRLEDGGKRLIVRGYIGFALFGRSQTWLRVEPPV